MSRALVHQQRLATNESWLIAKSRRLDTSFETLFYSISHIYSVKRWTIIQIFTRVPLKVDATRQKGENLCVFFSSFFFHSSTSTMIECVQTFTIPTEKWDYRAKEQKITFFVVVVAVVGCSCNRFRWFYLHEILALDTTYEVSVSCIARYDSSQVDTKNSLTWFCVSRQIVLLSIFLQSSA